MQRVRARPVSGHVFKVERQRGAQWYAKYRLPDGRQVQRRIGPHWPNRNSAPPAGYFTKRTAQAWLDEVLVKARRGDLPVWPAWRDLRRGVRRLDRVEAQPQDQALDACRLPEHDRPHQARVCRSDRRARSARAGRTRGRRGVSRRADGSWELGPNHEQIPGGALRPVRLGGAPIRADGEPTRARRAAAKPQASQYRRFLEGRDHGAGRGRGYGAGRPRLSDGAFTGCASASSSRCAGATSTSPTPRSTCA